MESFDIINTIENLNEAQRFINQTINLGTESLKSLQAQGETLGTIEDTLDSNKNILNKSMGVLKSMEWFGWVGLSGTVFARSSLLTASKQKNTNTPTITIANVPEKENIPTKLPEPDCHKLFSPIASSNVIINQQDKNLEIISNGLEQLHLISTTMQSHLVSNQETMERINDKTEQVNGITLATIIKSARIFGSYEKNQSIPLGYFQFVDVVTGKFLAVENDFLTLTKNSCLSTQFACETTQSKLIGISNMLTLKYIGTSLLGSIKVAGEYWGRMEDCFMDLSGQPTGILVVGRNWGSGAWIKNTTGNNKYLTDSTSGIHDKNSMLVVKACKLTNGKSN